MALQLRPLGHLVVHPNESYQSPGPIADRSATLMRSARWKCELFELEAAGGFGSYLSGPHAAEVNVRLVFRASDGLVLFLDYVARGHMPTHAAGRTPVFMSGRVDVDPRVAKLAWLNQTQVVGRGMLTTSPLAQTYEMYALAG
jgi:hypothetical protein